MDLTELRTILENEIGEKITNIALCRALDMKPPSISRKIKDKSKIKLTQFKQIEDYFGVDLSKYYNNVFLDECYNFCNNNDDYEMPCNSLFERLEFSLKNNKVCPGISFYGLSRFLGVSMATFTELKAGRLKKLSNEAALKISQFLGVSFKWLITGEGEVFEETFDLKKGNFSGVEDNFKQAFKNFGKIQEINDLTDGEMAKILGMPEHKYVKIASGKDKITMDVILKLKENFNVNIDAFLFKKEKVNSGEELTLTKDEVVKLKSFLNRF